MADLFRVFFHELGHFVAREINSLLYNGTNVKWVVMSTHADNKELFLGETKVEKNVEGKHDGPY